MEYVSTRGGIEPAGFEEAVLRGFAPDGGLYLPTRIPEFTKAELQAMADLSYQELAEKILRPYIPKDQIPDHDLRLLLAESFAGFTSKEITPQIRLEEEGILIQELFHGPSQSFKDIAMGFLINCMDYFLSRKKEQLSLILATTGDTGPAAAHAAAGKKSLHCWPLYPLGMITEEQERQMTTLHAANVHPVGVRGCTNGVDDLDGVIARLFADKKRKKELCLSSVNSINWGRVLVQTVHYFYGYFRAAAHIGEPISFSVPAGAFGNLCAGFFARAMGLPIKNLLCATNDNGVLHRVFADGLLVKKDLKQTLSSAIDIVVPYNFWRFLYYLCDRDPEQIRKFMDEFAKTDAIRFDSSLRKKLGQGFLSTTVSDQQTLETIQKIYRQCDGYLLDPHGAVAVAGAANCAKAMACGEKIICLATAHPAKFPYITEKALAGETPAMAHHPGIEGAKAGFQYLASCELSQLEDALVEDIRGKMQYPKKDLS